MWRHLPRLLIATVFAILVYTECFLYDSFAPEFPFFYHINRDVTFSALLHQYTVFDQVWYRPTAFFLPYWIGRHFLSWHDLFGWRVFYFLTFLATCYSVYALALKLFTGNRTAALLAVFYYASHPCVYLGIFEVCAFDFLYILFTVLSALAFHRALETTGGRRYLAWSASFLLFVAGLTSKEPVIVLPFLLLVLVLLTCWRDKARLWPWLAALIPFFAVVVLYAILHLARAKTADLAPGHQPYGTHLDLLVLFENLRKYPLWIVRIFWGTGDHLLQDVYHNNLKNNVAGLALTGAVIAGWVLLIRGKTSVSLPTSLMVCLAWIAIFLAVPIYGGGYLWHANLALVGYAILFGEAIAALLELLSVAGARTATQFVLAAFFIWLARGNVNEQLYSGTHTTGYRLNQDLLRHPPIPPEELGAKPLIYIEDRYNLGGWWYGMGYLMQYVYLRSDIEQQQVPAAEKISEQEWLTWRKHDNAFFLHYDDRFQWSDLTDSLRWRVSLKPESVTLTAGAEQQFHLTPHQGVTLPAVTWSIVPSAGELDSHGVFRAPWGRLDVPEGTLALDPPFLSVSPSQSARFSAFLSQRKDVKVLASTERGERVGTASMVLNHVATPARVRWSVDPPEAGTISTEGVFEPSRNPAAGKATVRAISESNPSQAASAAVRIGAFQPIRIRAGSTLPAVIGGAGWSPDFGYESGDVFPPLRARHENAPPGLYDSERFDTRPFAYRFSVPNGRYSVVLHFAEIWFKEPNKRVFHVALNGQRVLDHLDVLARSGGPARPFIHRASITVIDNQIRIEFLPVVSNPKISAIEILPQ